MSKNKKKWRYLGNSMKKSAQDSTKNWQKKMAKIRKGKNINKKNGKKIIKMTKEIGEIRMEILKKKFRK